MQVCNANLNVLLPPTVHNPFVSTLCPCEGILCKFTRNTYQHYALCAAYVGVALPRAGRVVLKPGMERNGTNGTVIFRRKDEDRTYFCL